MGAAGLKSPDLYFTKPTPEDIRRRMQATEQQQPDAAMQRLQMEAQLAAEKVRMTVNTTIRAKAVAIEKPGEEGARIRD